MSCCLLAYSEGCFSLRWPLLKTTAITIMVSNRRILTIVAAVDTVTAMVVPDLLATKSDHRR